MSIKGVGPKNDPWFRMHHKLLNDPIVQRLPAEHFKIYINLLCYAASRHENGNLGDESTVAFALRCDVASCCIALQEVGLIEVNATDDATLQKNYRIPQWSKMQYKSDSSTERSRKHRAIKKNGRDGSCNVAETLHATPQKQKQIRAEADKKTIQKKELSDAIKNAFEDFYQAHPKRTKKKEACAKFTKLVAKATLPEEVHSIAELLISDMGKRLRSGMWSTADGERGFIPGPAPYLNGEMWNDEIVERGNDSQKSGGFNTYRPTATEQMFDDLRDTDFHGGSSFDQPGTDFGQVPLDTDQGAMGPNVTDLPGTMDSDSGSCISNQ